MKHTLSLRATVELQCMSKYICIVIRNAMEDFHHKHLSDEQMKELNPIIRDAVFTALYARQIRHISGKADQYVGENLAMIPDYWENPQLLSSFAKVLENE